MFEKPIVSFEPTEGFSLVGVDLLVDEEDFSGVHIAVETLTSDFAKVTKQRANTKTYRHVTQKRATKNCIFVGTLAQSSTVQALKDSGKIDTSKIESKWESWMTVCVSDPFDAYENSLVIIGSDKRGAIYGAYSLSEQIGISPWHWWADVPPKIRTEIYTLPDPTTNGEPSVRYRGIFINDEAPAMDSWVREKFGPKFDTQLYKHIFELLLRLKANYLWPASWRGYPYPGRSFFVDDPENQKTADEYGIVMGTSHHEPMQRAMNEWSTNEPGGTWNWESNREKVRKYFEDGAARAAPFESYLTMGMRGEGDSPIGGGDPIALLTDILQNQRDIIKDKYGSESGEMQLLALYREVQQYYEQGLQIPEDITLLFADDNFGSIRRLPTEKERNRPGRCGFYYHFQYTGYPRSYRWMNSNTMGRVWHQLQLGHHRGADQIWIFNVGDLKPQELPLNFAFDLAWNVKSIAADGFKDYFKSLAAREFGDPYAARIGSIWYEFDRLIALRKQEHVDISTFSILKWREAEKVLARWKDITDEAEAIYAEISTADQPAFFELVLHPVKASYVYNLLRTTQTKNDLYARQRRNTANKLLHECLRLFDEDDALTRQYHTILDGKWNHMLRQPHYGYNSGGIGPYRDMISGLSWVRANTDSNPIMGQMGIAVEGHEGKSPGIINEDADLTHPSRAGLEAGVTLKPISPYGPQGRFFEIYHRGTIGFDWEAKPQYSWIKLSRYEGTLNPSDDDTRVDITIEWENVPEGFDKKIYIEVIGNLDGYEQVRLQVQKRQAPSDFRGFVQSEAYVSIDPGNWVVSPYMHLPAMGRQEAGSVTLPNETDTSKPDDIAFLKYDVYTFTDGGSANLEVHFHMTLETDPDNFMQYDIRWDGGETETYRLTEKGNGELPMGWSKAVMDCVWKKKHNLGQVKAGSHTIEIRLRNLNVVLEKVVLDLGGTEMKYLGPPESSYVAPDETLDSKTIEVGESDTLRIDMKV